MSVCSQKIRDLKWGEPVYVMARPIPGRTWNDLNWTSAGQKRNWRPCKLDGIGDSQRIYIIDVSGAFAIDDFEIGPEFEMLPDGSMATHFPDRVCQVYVEGVNTPLNYIYNRDGNVYIDEAYETGLKKRDATSPVMELIYDDNEIVGVELYSLYDAACLELLSIPVEHRHSLDAAIRWSCMEYSDRVYAPTLKEELRSTSPKP